jgi:hypothetical protein
MTTNTPTPSSARALVSRITSPFTAKTKNISEFYIKTAEPHRQYAPGDVVKGSVILTVNKPVRITHLVICIRGFVKVYKNPNLPGQGISKEAAFIGTGRGERGSEYFGNGFATIFEKELALCGEGRLQPTVYSFEFELPVRSWGVPSSIDASLPLPLELQRSDSVHLVRARHHLLSPHCNTDPANHHLTYVNL